MLTIEKMSSVPECCPTFTDIVDLKRYCGTRLCFPVFEQEKIRQILIKWHGGEINIKCGTIVDQLHSTKLKSIRYFAIASDPERGMASHYAETMATLRQDENNIDILNTFNNKTTIEKSSFLYKNKNSIFNELSKKKIFKNMSKASALIRCFRN